MFTSELHEAALASAALSAAEATFSTVMNERCKADRQVIDLMLAHTPIDKVEGAYNRAAHLERRTELAQAWADLIMVGQVPAEELVVGPRRVRDSDAA